MFEDFNTRPNDRTAVEGWQAAVLSEAWGTGERQVVAAGKQSSFAGAGTIEIPSIFTSDGKFKADNVSRFDGDRQSAVGDGTVAIFIEDEAKRYDKRSRTYYNGDKPVYQYTDTGFKRWDSDGNLQATGSYNPHTKTYTTEYTEGTTQYKVVETPKGTTVYEKGPASDDWSAVTDSSTRKEAIQNAHDLRRPPKLQTAS